MLDVVSLQQTFVRVFGRPRGAVHLLNQCNLGQVSFKLFLIAFGAAKAVNLQCVYTVSAVILRHSHLRPITTRIVRAAWELVEN